MLPNNNPINDFQSLTIDSLNDLELSNRRQIIHENINYKKTIVQFKTRTIFKFDKNIKMGHLEPSIKIFAGNYCYHLEENYMSSKDKNSFLHYYGEEKIDEVEKKFKHQSFKEISIVLPDDLHFNLEVLFYLKNYTTIKELLTKLPAFLRYKKLKPNSLENKIKRLYDRFHAINDNEKQFYHMSCSVDEPKTYECLCKTNKQIYCSICRIYDCNMHSQPEETFDNPQGYNVKEYLRSYKEMNEYSLKCQDKKSTADNNDNDNKGNKGNDEDNITNPLTEIITANCEMYNKIILENKLSHFSGFINVKEQKTMNNLNNKECGCGLYCYKNYLLLNNDTKMKLYSIFAYKPLPHLYEIYLPKLLQITKYDPCSIATILNTCVSYNDPIIDNDRLIKCYMIFLRLQSYDYALSKPLTKEVIDSFMKERTTEKKKMEPQRLRLIKDNVKNHKIVPYRPCFHLGTEACNDSCPCASRGFCEKYCVCNKQLCKITWKGCHCKGPCNSSLCPCYVGNRECDYDLCQSKYLKPLIHFIDCNDHSTCRNLKLQKKDMKRIGVGQSSIVGWGLFALEDCKKDDLIGEYIGEMIDMESLHMRSEFIDYEKTTYMFTLNDDYTVDSRSMGNSLRFANHSRSKANATTRIIFVNGRHCICLYALDNIQKDDEIFFDYDGENVLREKYDWIDDGIAMNSSNAGSKYTKANKTVGFLSIKRKRKEDEFNESIEGKNTFELLSDYCKRNKNKTRIQLRRYCLKKGYASFDNVGKFLDDYQQKTNYDFYDESNNNNNTNILHKKNNESKDKEINRTENADNGDNANVLDAFDENENKPTSDNNDSSNDSLYIRNADNIEDNEKENIIKALNAIKTVFTSFKALNDL